MSEEAEQAKQSAFPAPPPYWQLSGLEPPPVPHRDDSSQGRYFSFGALLQADTFEPTLDDGLEKLLPLREDGSVDFAAEKLDPSEKLRTWNRQNLRDFAKLLRVLVRPLKQPSQVSVESSEQQTSLGLSDVQDEDHLEMRRLLRAIEARFGNSQLLLNALRRSQAEAALLNRLRTQVSSVREGFPSARRWLFCSG
ncbi:MAG: hypothetical protein MHM6MM_002757 [Cercozoa sp. M6MM]